MGAAGPRGRSCPSLRLNFVSFYGWNRRKRPGCLATCEHIRSEDSWGTGWQTGFCCEIKVPEQEWGLWGGIGRIPPPSGLLAPALPSHPDQEPQTCCVLGASLARRGREGSPCLPAPNEA